MARRPGLAAAGISTLLLLPVALAAAPPQPAPPVYATANYGLTFRSPRGATYCPLPRDWVGSDHGTVLFLERPRSCGGAGYPSSGRRFEPDVARIELYYGFAESDNPAALPRCPGGSIRFVGGRRPICMDRGKTSIRASLQTRYMVERQGSRGQVVLTLVTRPERFRRDLAVFRRLAATLRTCSTVWPSVNGHPASIVGVGPRCPNVGTF